MHCDDRIARFAYIIFFSFCPYSSFLIIPEVNLSHVRLRCEVDPHGGQRVWRRCEETMTREHLQRRALVPKRALNQTCAASHTVHLAIRDYRLELPMIWGRLPVALKRHTNESLKRLNEWCFSQHRKQPARRPRCTKRVRRPIKTTPRHVGRDTSV